ncbi:hypothetical protein GC079_06640 [Neisseria meningitidis]|nr:hypothetical protein [Neisseria meningitidis]MBJ6653539.1 hypothetical protein [Neisseria meningitidis]
MYRPPPHFKRQSFAVFTNYDISPSFFKNICAYLHESKQNLLVLQVQKQGSACMISVYLICFLIWI